MVKEHQAVKHYRKIDILRKNKELKLSIFALLIIISGFLILFFSTKDKSVDSLLMLSDLTNHAIYSQYDFNQNDSIHRD